MRVLHICRQFHPLVGGIENYVLEVALRSQRRGIDSRVLTLDHSLLDRSRKLPSRDEVRGVETIRIPAFGHPKKPLPLAPPWRQLAWADIVHTHDLRFLYETTVLLKKRLGYAVVLSSHGLLFHTNALGTLKTLMMEHYYRPTFARRVDAIICSSEQDRRYLAQWSLPGLRLIENGIDAETVGRTERAPVAGRLLYFGRIDEMKGLDLLLRALGHLQDKPWHLDIAGSGNPALVAALKSLAASLGLGERTTFLGFCPQQELLKLLARAQLCFFPSTYEGFGLTLLEAMACGCVCVANDIPAYRSTLGSEEQGLLVDFRNPQVLAERQVLSLPSEKLGTISAQARRRAQGYDWERKIEDVLSVYRQVLG